MREVTDLDDEDEWPEWAQPEAKGPWPVSWLAWGAVVLFLVGPAFGYALARSG